MIRGKNASSSRVLKLVTRSKTTPFTRICIECASYWHGRTGNVTEKHAARLPCAVVHVHSTAQAAIQRNRWLHRLRCNLVTTKTGRVHLEFKRTAAAIYTHSQQLVRTRLTARIHHYKTPGSGKGDILRRIDSGV
jgi:hypothetical protein